MKKRPTEFFSILYLILWTFAPPLQIDLIFRLLALVCAGILFYKNGFTVGRKQGIALIFCLLVAFSAVIGSGSISAALAQISVYMLFIGYSMNVWYEHQWQDFRGIVPIILLAMAFWNYRTLAVLADNPFAARLVVRDDEIANELLRQGVGGYSLVYCQTMIAPAIVKWTMCAWKRDKPLFVCGAVWMITFVLCVMKAGYTIAVVTVFIGIIVLLFYKKRKIGRALLVTGIVIALTGALILYNETVRNFVLDIFEGTKVEKKIEDIISTAITNDTADSISERISRYQASIESFFIRYPLIGSWWNSHSGGHSAILDSFAQYGIFGGTVMISMIYCVPIKWKKYDCSQAAIRAVNAAIITISFVALLDSMPFNLTMTPTVLLPILLTDIEQWSRENEGLMDSEPDSDGTGE